MTLGEKIYQYRTQKNLSQGDLADALNVSRQSISKWENNGAVPELDKLVKLSEIFGVTLDELVLDKKAPDAVEETKVVYVEKRSGSSKTAGVVLLCFAVLVWLLVSLLGDVLAGLVLASPFLACGLICLLAKKHTGLWCTWVVYLFIEIYLRFATGVSWQYVFSPFAYYGGQTVQLIVAWCLLGSFAVMVGITSLRFRKNPKTSLKKDGVTAAILWAVYLITWVILAVSSKPITSSTEIVLRRLLTTVIGFVRSLDLAAACVFSVRFLTMVRKKK